MKLSIMSLACSPIAVTHTSTERLALACRALTALESSLTISEPTVLLARSSARGLSAEVWATQAGFAVVSIGSDGKRSARVVGSARELASVATLDCIERAAERAESLVLS